MDEFPADAAAVALADAIAGDAVSDLVETAEFFDSRWIISPGSRRW